MGRKGRVAPEAGGNAQKTTAGHRKLAVTLRATYEQCIAGTGTIGSTVPGGGGQKGEKAFVKEFFRFLDRVLVVKKGEVVADRCLRFVDMFVRGLLEKDKPKPKPKPKKPKPTPATDSAEGDPPAEDAASSSSESEPPFDPTTFTPQPPHRFVLALLQHLTPILNSKEKAARYRTTQLLSLLLSNTLPTFPTDFSTVSKRIFTKTLTELTKRLKDREAPVRVQAVVALVRLLEMGVDDGADPDDANSDDEAAASAPGGALALLLDAIEKDPSADVRRTVLYNVSPTPHTLPYLLARTRDIDSATRRSVFTRLLPTLGDFRHLSIGMREKLLRWGLNDRDESVRVAARKMFNYRWVEDVGGDLLSVLERLDVVGDGSQGGVKEVAMRGFWSERKDVVEQVVLDEEFWENLTAESAFLARSFNDYVKSGGGSGGERGGVAELEEKMPEVTRLAFWLKGYINKLIAAVEDEGEEAGELEFIVEQMLMIALKTDYGDEIGRRKMFSLLRESLGIPQLTEGVTKLVVECLGKLSMGEGDFCMLILEVIAEVHDAIEDEQEGDETVGDDAASESFHSAQSDIEDGVNESITVRKEKEKEKERERKKAASDSKKKKKKQKKQKQQQDDEDVDMMDVDDAEEEAEEEEDEEAASDSKKKKKKQKKQKQQQDDEDVDMMDVDDAEEEAEEEEDEEEDEEEARALKEMMINLKCLHIAQCMLENVEGSLKQNTHLVSMLNGLIVPAVRSHEAPVRERGLHCLGLSCLLDRTLAEENLTLFAHCFNKGHEALQISALHIISDILTIHGSTLFTSPSCAVDQRTLYRLLAKALKLDDHTDVQSTAAEVVCKLMLAQVIQDDELLKFLVVAYFDPGTVDNHALRQILTYFFPVYCHSRPANQARMARGVVGILHALVVMRDGMGEEEEMVGLGVVCAQLADWTDPRRNVGGGVSAGKGGVAERVVDPDVQVVLAGEMLERVFAGGCVREEKKCLLSTLAKLYIPADANPEHLRTLYELVARAIEENVAQDAPSRNALNKLEVSLGKIVGDLAAAAEDTVIVPAEGDEDGEEGSEGEGTVVTAVLDGREEGRYEEQQQEEEEKGEEEEEEEEEDAEEE
ncbi:hypothetical protein P167DRAFT_565197 [Morchella conica CCBAS932]|uniref:Nuclear condensin complex subunit 3 C-terminal domain-containing protein n=1 Tax=Morchella conica CCBAS932 TaxID=1392247 RepID=A0A3N4KSY1_9PEZI|nr:hypothetical protein P167DRAFT_565197 [Morchella conica CCBAS932]